ncbi:MAG: RNA-binding protein [Bacteroidetes bacterium]|nr:RNA-binding protein [Bacteroidota bacterium]
MKLYVGNLPYQFSNDDLAEAFNAYGEVVSATIIKDKVTGRSKGFGFVEMKDASSGTQAITGLNGKELAGRTINVSEARPRENSGGGGGGFQRGGGGGGYRR